MSDAERERRLDLFVDALRQIGVYTEAELAEARERMERVESDPTVSNRIAGQRVQGGSGW